MEYTRIEGVELFLNPIISNNLTIEKKIALIFYSKMICHMQN